MVDVTSMWAVQQYRFDFEAVQVTKKMATGAIKSVA